MKRIINDFDFLKINLASPQRIRQWSERILPDGQIVGEVTTPETLNYRSLRPEINGLFCEKIFGPVKNGECYCGKYKQVRNRVFTCERCGVDLTEAKVRRHRMGYVELESLLSHVWYLKGVPSYLAIVLNQKLRFLEAVIYSTPPLEDLEEFFGTFQIYNENENSWRKTPKVGGEILFEQLQKINLEEQIKANRSTIPLFNIDLPDTKKLIRQTRIFELFLSTNSKPEWMILKVLPVIPPGLRPMIQLEGGRYASSDLNEFYRTVLIRNNRLSRLISSNAPYVIIRNEKRMLQEAVDNLIDNGKRGPKRLDTKNRPLKSLADRVEGKQGRFRQNLLGKRVDYSGRSVIVVGPTLKLNQCGLPYDLATELFYPFITYEMLVQGITETIKNAKRLIHKQTPSLWKLIKEVVESHPILLNRAPTLHRLGIQAFDPVLIRGLAIQLHPLVCPAFNADFDGDQMAVHIPLSLEAQTEARILMLSPNNFLSPATGEPILQPTQDMLLGCYYLTLTNRSKLLNANHYFGSFQDVLFAYEHKKVDLHSSVWVRCLEKINFEKESTFLQSFVLSDQSVVKLYKDLQLRYSKEGKLLVHYLRTTPGRIIFHQSLDSLFDF
jgi:DNA-directed RNA polymerase subunit beta'